MSLFGATPNLVVAQAQVNSTPGEIKAKLDEALRVMPPANAAADPLWQDQANALRSRLSSFPPANKVAATIERSTELTALIKSLPASTDINLRAALDALVEVASLDLRSRIDRLAMALRAASAPNDDLQKSLADLVAAIGTLEAKAPGINPTQVAIEKANALSQALTAPDIIATAPGLSKTVSTLITALEGLEEVDFLKSVVRRSNSLSGLLGKAGAIPPISLAAISATTTLQDSLLAYRKHGNPTVDIIYAEYGDLRDRDSQRRRRQVCDATAAMRNICQGQPSCTLPASASTALCGSDPAEFVSAPNKGAWILFRCVDSLLNIYSPPALPSMQPSRGNSNWVPLRGETQTFSCVPPRLND